MPSLAAIVRAAGRLVLEGRAAWRAYSRDFDALIAQQRAEHAVARRDAPGTRSS